MKQFLLIFSFCLLRVIAYDYRLINQKKYSMVNPLNNSQHLTLVHIKKISLQCLLLKILELKSCLQAAYYGSKHEEINININGTDLIVHCDQTTDGGGWTRILDKNEIVAQPVLIPIDDLGLYYTQLLFKAKSEYFMDFSFNLNPSWNFDGYNFVMNAFKFDDNWLMSEQEPIISGNEEYTNTFYLATRGTITNKVFFDIDTDINILTPSDICYFGTINQPEYCGKQFILKTLPSGRLNAISDLQSISLNGYLDNQMSAYFEIYVR